MAYTVSQFITQAEAGGAVLISKPAGNTQVILKIGGQTVALSDTQVTVSMSAAGKAVVSTAQNTLDLGLHFSAAQVLDSASLRRAIDSEIIIAEAGTTALSKIPTV
jgi:hypothetical protein